MNQNPKETYHSEELEKVNKKLEILLGKGSNDEKLVDKKRALEKVLRDGEN